MRNSKLWWKRHRLVGLSALVVGVGVVYHAQNLSVGSLTQPGAGMWPLLIGLATIGAGVAALGTHLESSEDEQFTRGSVLIGPALLSLFLFVWAFTALGFLVSGFSLSLFWLKVLGRGGWFSSLLIAAIATAAFQFLFVSLLGLPFPEDVLIPGR